MPGQPFPLESFKTFGDLLKYLRRRQRLTQLELSIAVGYSEAQITRLEKNQRHPDLSALKALFVPALQIQDEPDVIHRLLELASVTRQEDAPAPGLPPYKGLLYFEEADAENFFGREHLVSLLVERVSSLQSTSSTRLFSIVGSSGSGKSSLVRAGLAVALRSKGWEVCVITPGKNPLMVLESQFDSNRVQPNAQAVIVVDQFEEIFTLCKEEIERNIFIEKLLNFAQFSSGNITLVVVLRADFYSHCAQYPDLRNAIASNQEYIGQMTAQELRRAIEEPAKQGGWDFEPGLVEVLLNDIGAYGANGPEPGALPLLSHALLVTWERRRGKTFTLQGYQSSGGVRSAIAETAESVFTDQLNVVQQALARDIFLRLTELGEGTEDTRRRVSLNELAFQPQETAQLRGILNTLTEARLVTINEDSVEVSHEALIREWRRLHGWLTNDRESLRLHRRITEAAYEWEKMGRDPSELFRGARLALAREWVSSNEEKLNEAERAFISASLIQEESEEIAREKQRQREIEAIKKLAEAERTASIRLRFRNRVITIVAGIALIFAVAAISFGLQSNKNAAVAVEAQSLAQQNEKIAEKAMVEAEKHQRLAFARELAANANGLLEVDPELSILVALQGVEATTPDDIVLPEVLNALHQAVLKSRIEKTMNGHEGRVRGIAFNPTGNALVTGGEDGQIIIWSVPTYEETIKIDAHIGEINDISFDPAGNRFAAAGYDGIIKVWNTKNQTELVAIQGHSGEVFSVQFSPDGSRIVSSGLDNTIRFWDANTGQELITWQVPNVGPLLVYDETGTRVFFWSDFQLKIRNIDSGEDILSIPAGEYIFALSPDNQKIAAVSEDGGFIRILNTFDGKVIYNISYPSNQIEHMEFSPDGSQLVSVGRDRKAHIWDVESGIEIITLGGHREFIATLAFTPDGKYVATSGFDGIIKVWSMEDKGELFSFSGGGVRMALSPDGRYLATIGPPWSPQVLPTLLQVFDLQTRNRLFSYQAENEEFIPVVFHPDGTRLAIAGRGGAVKILDASTGKATQVIPVKDVFITALAYSPDGNILATGGVDGFLRLYESKTGGLFEEWDPNLGSLSAVKFSPDGTIIGVTSDRTNEIKLLNASTGKEVSVLIGHTNSNWNLDFSSDGTKVVTTGRDGTIRTWDAFTGKLLFTINGHTSTVSGLDLSPDNRLIASAGTDGAVHVWDIATGQELLSLESDGTTFMSAIITPDGNRLIIGGRDDVYGIALTTEELVVIAQSRLTRWWTMEECQRYLHTKNCPPAP